MKIIITNWEEYNPRKDLKSMPWFRIKSDIGFSETLFGVDPDLKWLWIFILSHCAKKISEEIEVNFQYMAFHSGLSKERIEKGIQLFERKGLVQVTDESDLITNEPVPKKREEERREEEKRGEEKPSRAIGCISTFDDDDEIKKFLAKVPQSSQERWLKIYPDIAWLKSEILKAMTWIELNPQRRPQKNGRFLGSWFSRGWESYRKTIPSNKQSVSSQKIWQAISSGKQRVDECDLSDQEKNWIKDHGGLVQLGRSSEFEIKKLLRA